MASQGSGGCLGHLSRKSGYYSGQLKGTFWENNTSSRESSQWPNPPNTFAPLCVWPLVLLCWLVKCKSHPQVHRWPDTGGVAQVVGASCHLRECAGGLPIWGLTKGSPVRCSTKAERWQSTPAHCNIPRHGTRRVRCLCAGDADSTHPLPGK